MWKSLALAAAAALLGPALASPARAQPLDQEIDRLLDNDCGGLGVFGGNDSNPGALGPNLDAICDIISIVPTATTTGGGASSSQASDSSVSRRRAEERMEEQRQLAPEGGEASERADPTRVFSGHGLGVWATGNFDDRDRDTTRFEDGYDSTVQSVGVGADYSFGPAFFAGLAVDYATIDGDFNGGGGFETESLGGLAYASVSPLSGLFLDGVVGYAWKDYEVDRAVSYSEFDPFQQVVGLTVAGISSGDTDGEAFEARALLGYDHVTASGVSIGPRVGVDFVHNEIDGYRESGGTGLELVYEDRTRQSLRSSLGASASVAASTGFGVVIPEIGAAWVHEFQDDRRHHRVRFAEDLRASPMTFTFENERPDRDFLELDGSVAVVLARGVQAFVAVRTILGHAQFDSFGGSVGVRLEL